MNDEVISLLAHLFLILAILFAFWQHRPAAWFFAGISLLTAFTMGEMRFIGLALIASLGLSAFLYAKVNHPFARGLCAVIFLGLAVLAALHLLPGIANPLLVDTVLTPDAVPFKMYLNLDKPFVGLFVLLYGLSRAELGWPSPRWLLLPLFFLVLLTMPLALAFRYVALAPKLPNFTPLWLLNNLFFVCVAEESFFRGIVQEQFRDRFPILGVVIGAMLFGLAHFQGGSAYVCFAILAGLAYGTAFLKSRRLGTAIAVHFLFNSIHFFLFTYPALAG